MASLLPFKRLLKDRLKAAFDTICMLVIDDKLHGVCVKRRCLSSQERHSPLSWPWVVLWSDMPFRTLKLHLLALNPHSQGFQIQDCFYMTLLALKRADSESDRTSESAFVKLALSEDSLSCHVSIFYGISTSKRRNGANDAGLEVIYCVHISGQGRVLIQARRRALF